MINSHKYLRTALIAAITLGTNAAIAQMDVDQADSLNFQSFHKDKKEAIKVWDKNSSTTTKAYQDQTAAGATATPAPATVSPVAADTAPSKSLTTAAVGTPGKRFEIRERYTLSHSAKTPYSAFYVIEPMVKQAAQLCPKGWKKLTEKSEPIEQDFYLYYEIECL